MEIQQKALDKVKNILGRYGEWNGSKEIRDMALEQPNVARALRYIHTWGKPIISQKVWSAFQYLSSAIFKKKKHQFG